MNAAAVTNRKREKMCNMLIKGCKEKADQRVCKEKGIHSDSHWYLCVCFVCVYNVTGTYMHAHTHTHANTHTILD